MPGAPRARSAEVHHVPAGGITVFALPDVTAAPIAELPSGHEVTVVGRRSPWVHVQASDGLDGWVDGVQLAGVAMGASPVPEPVAVPQERTNTIPPPPGSVVVEKQGSSFLLGTGPVLGALGGAVAILGTALPWVQTTGTLLHEVDAFGLPVRILSGWDEIAKGGWELGWLIVVLAGLGAVVSMISGGGIVRRILGFAIVMICAVYVLQTQDLLTSTDRGLGTGLNVWDLVDYGVLVSFGGGLLMVFAPSR
jgi:hypothetical protein